jgi:hypothetical protein
MRPPRQIGWVISVEDWALIRRLVADGVPQRQVARQLGVGRSTVARVAASDTPPKYERRPVMTSFSSFEPRVAALLAEFPEMPATVIAERVGWDGSPSWFRENVARIRPQFRRPDPADRLTWSAGDAAQCDLWFPSARIVQLRPRDPESKGIVERRNGFFETSFMPGRVFASPADFNAQFTGCLERANSRIVRTLRARPADPVGADRAAMLPLPAIPPQLGWHHQVRLGRDYYVRLDASDYSVDPAVIGRLVEVTADLERVLARTGGHVVADHARMWARGRTVTDPAHAATARRLRQEFRQPRRPDPACDLTRDLADYDRAFGLVTADGEVAS